MSQIFVEQSKEMGRGHCPEILQDHFEGSSARPNYIYYIFYKL